LSRAGGRRLWPLGLGCFFAASLWAADPYALLERARLKLHDGEPAEAVEDYKAYLELVPGNLAAQAECTQAEKLTAAQKTHAGSPAGRLYGKHVLLQVEVPSASFGSLDLGFVFGGHHDVGLGGIYLNNSLGQFESLHPRYRYHFGGEVRSTFWEIGGVHWVSKGAASYPNDFDGADLGIGSAWIGHGPFIASLSVAVVAGRVYAPKAIVDGKAEDYGYQFFGYPMICGSIGLGI
jgi:hypothetical protein